MQACKHILSATHQEPERRLLITAGNNTLFSHNVQQVHSACGSNHWVCLHGHPRAVKLLDGAGWLSCSWPQHTLVTQSQDLVSLMWRFCFQ